MQNDNIGNTGDEQELFNKFKAYIKKGDEPKTEPKEDVLNDLSSSGSEIEAKPRAKRILTEKQLDNLNKGREKRNEERKRRADEREVQEQEQRQEIEKKIIRKAIAIKKKEIKREKVLELTSSDEEIETEKIEIPKPKPKKKTEPVITISTEPKRRTITFM